MYPGQGLKEYLSLIPAQSHPPHGSTLGVLVGRDPMSLQWRLSRSLHPALPLRTPDGRTSGQLLRLFCADALLGLLILYLTSCRLRSLFFSAP